MTSPIEFHAGLRVGTVEAVGPDSIEVVLLEEAPHGTALNARLPSGFPRLNGLLVIPSGAGAMLVMVAWVGIDRERRTLRRKAEDLVDLPAPRRRLRVIPLGTIVLVDGETRVQRGVLTFPTVGDPVSVATADQITAFTRSEGERFIELGHAPLAGNAAVTVDIDALLGQHLAILGATGSGKSCTTASVIRQTVLRVAADGPPPARIIVLDTNGEYASTFGDLPITTTHLSIEPTGGAQQFRVPAWLWNAREWISFAGARPGAQAPYVRRALATLRSGSRSADPNQRRATTTLRLLHASARNRADRGPAIDFRTRMDDGDGVSAIGRNCRYLSSTTADEALRVALDEVAAAASDIRNSRKNGQYWEALTVGDWVRLQTGLRGCLDLLPEPTTSETHEDDPLPFDLSLVAPTIQLIAAEDPSGGGASWVAPLLFRLENLLADRRLRSLAEDDLEIDDIGTWLDQVLGRIGEGQLTIIDLSLVPAKALHHVVAVLGRIIFEAHERFRRVHGDPLATLLVAEEAHMFLPRRSSRTPDDSAESATELCRDTFDRIAREGRKFGLSLLVASQRPAELSETILSQCSNFMVHRIVNEADQDLVRRLVPDSLGPLLRELPALPAGVCLGMGTAFRVPTLIQMMELEDGLRPNSATPSFFDAWTALDPAGGWTGVASSWAVHADLDGEGDREEPF